MNAYTVPEQITPEQPKPEGKDLGNVEQLLAQVSDERFLRSLPAEKRQLIEQMLSTIRGILYRQDISNEEKQRQLEILIPKLQAMV